MRTRAPAIDVDLIVADEYLTVHRAVGKRTAGVALPFEIEAERHAPPDAIGGIVDFEPEGFELDREVLERDEARELDPQPRRAQFEMRPARQRRVVDDDDDQRVTVPHERQLELGARKVGPQYQLDARRHRAVVVGELAAPPLAPIGLGARRVARLVCGLSWRGGHGPTLRCDR